MSIYIPFMILLIVAFSAMSYFDRHICNIVPAIYMLILLILEFIKPYVSINSNFIKIYSGISLIVIVLPIIHYIRKGSDWYDDDKSHVKPRKR